LRDWLRGKIRELFQELLEEEVTEFLGRARYERRAPVDASGYRNGYGKPRKLTTPMGTIEVRRPRVRGVEERFDPKEHWVHIRTTNVVESPFAALRLRTDAAKRFKKVERATAVIWKMLMVAQVTRKRTLKLTSPLKFRQ